MWSFLKIAFGSLGGIADVVGGVSKDITALKIKRLEAGTETEKAQIDLEIARLEGQASVLREETKYARTAWIRPSLAFPIVVILWKLFIWDKAIGGLAYCSSGLNGYFDLGYCGVFRTDPLDQNSWWIIMTVLGAYFLGRAYEKARR